MTERTDLLIWCDLETTGFDNDFKNTGSTKHKILEIAIHITDSQLNVIDQGLKIVIHHDINDLIPLMDDKVLGMHTQSGLLNEVKKSSTTLEQAQKEVINYFKKFDIKPKSSPLCGNNISFDKNFIDAQMSEFSNYLHYRKIDVSSFKELFSRLYSDSFEHMPKRLAHRGLDDIKESIKELKSYKSLFLVDPQILIEKNDKIQTKTLKTKRLKF